MPGRRLLVLVCAVGWAVTGCAGSVGEGGGSGTDVPGPTREPSTAPGATTVPFTLYTHCGIRELRFEGRYYERVGGPLSDGSGNPPAGWDNPEQRGLLTVSDDSAVFTDDHGHREHFEVRDGATEFFQICA